MKNLFAIDIDSNDDGLLPELKALQLRAVSEETSNRQDQIYDDIKALDKKASLPIVLSIIKYILLVFGFSLTSASISACVEDGASRRIYTFLAAGILLLVGCGILFLISKIKGNKVINSDEYKNTMSRSESIDKSVLFELNVPEDAPKVDILSVFYKIKNGEFKISPIGAQYESTEMRVFNEKGILCLSDMSTVYGIAPVNSFKKIEYIKKKASFSPWSKDEDYDSEKYKKYKISTDKYESEYYIKNLCSLQFEINGEEFEIIIPPYDIYAFEEITGLHPEYPEEIE